MKRAHRKVHFILWLVVGAVIFAVLALAVAHRPAEPVNDALPAALQQGAQ